MEVKGKKSGSGQRGGGLRRREENEKWVKTTVGRLMEGLKSINVSVFAGCAGCGRVARIS